MFYSKTTFSQVSARGIFDMKLRSSVLKVWGVQARLGSISKHSRGEEGLVYSKKAKDFLSFPLQEWLFHLCEHVSFPTFLCLGVAKGLGFRVYGKRSPVHLCSVLLALCQRDEKLPCLYSASTFFPNPVETPKK